MPSTHALIIVVGLTTIAYATSNLAANHYWRERPEVERATCRLLICADDLRVADAYRSLITGEESRDTISEFRAALARDSVSAYRWADLGEVFHLRGQNGDAERCFTRALELAPFSPTILLRTATFYFRIGESKKALPYTSRILSLIDVYDGIVFSYYARLGIATDDILKDGLPNSGRAAREYFRHCLREAPESTLAHVWDSLVSHGMNDDRTADEYARSLVGRRLFRQAREIWKEHVSTGGREAGVAGMIFNAGFEGEPSDDLFDWHVESADGIEIERDSHIRHAGAYSLHVRFSGTSNLHFRNVVQIVAPERGAYRLSAYVRTEGLTTDKGVGLRVVQNDDIDRVRARTPAVSGTRDWTYVETTFSLESMHTPLRLEVSREPSFRLDNRIKGDAWVDSVKLEKLR